MEDRATEVAVHLRDQLPRGRAYGGMTVDAVLPVGDHVEVRLSDAKGRQFGFRWGPIDQDHHPDDWPPDALAALILANLREVLEAEGSARFRRESLFRLDDSSTG